jgi:hypothetical protein
MHKLATLLTLTATAGVAAADTQSDHSETVEVRQINTAFRKIGCQRMFESCEGMTVPRTGLVVVDVAPRKWHHGRTSFVASLQASAQPEEGLVASQVVAGFGPRVALGRSWIQGGVGIAGSTLAPGPKTMSTEAVLSQHVPAATAGVGTHLTAFAVPLQLSLDVGAGFGHGDDRFGNIYQVTANLMSTDI